LFAFDLTFAKLLAAGKRGLLRARVRELYNHLLSETKEVLHYQFPQGLSMS